MQSQTKTKELGLNTVAMAGRVMGEDTAVLVLNDTGRGPPTTQRVMAAPFAGCREPPTAPGAEKKEGALPGHSAGSDTLARC